MHLRNRQRGLGLWGWIFVLGTLGFFTMVGLQLTPIYLSEMAIARVVRQTAQDSGNSSLPVQELRKAMKLRWDVEGITTLRVDEVKLVKWGQGRALQYDYKAEAPLFYNLYIGAHFQNTYPMQGGGAVE
jgi:hypothetical protein